jgi:hypothetical protein
MSGLFSKIHLSNIDRHFQRRIEKERTLVYNCTILNVTAACNDKCFITDKTTFWRVQHFV